MSVRDLLRVLVAGLLGSALPTTGLAQVPPGQRSFGTESFVEVVAGSLPVVISAGHGGGLEPAEIPDRSWGVTVQDGSTEALARELAAALTRLTGRHPHLVLSHLHRRKLDPNREIVEAAQGDPKAERAWNEFHGAIAHARQQATAAWGGGLYIDVHGHGHAIQRIEWGYALSAGDYLQSDAILDTQAFVARSSLRGAAGRPGNRHSQLLRGADSLGGLMQGRGYAGVPSPAVPAPGGDPYFDGGYSVRRWGSIDGSFVDGVQIEFPGDLRRSMPVRRAMVGGLAASIVTWLDRHLGIEAGGGDRITVRALDPALTESGAPTALRVERAQAAPTERIVVWSIGGRATPGADYRALPFVVTIPAGAAFVDVPVEPWTDTLDEGDETIRVQLFGGAEIGWPAVAEIVLRDEGQDPGLAMRLPLEAPVGGRMPDLSGRGRDAVLLPSPTQGPGPVAAGAVDAALWFDGIDDALRVADFGVAPGLAFTLSFWFRAAPPASGASGFRYLVSHGAVGAPSSLQVYFLESSRTLRTYLRFDNARSPNSHLDVPENLMDGAWHHYALSASAGGRSFVAIDGLVLAENPHAGDRYDPSGPLFFGGRADGDPARFFAGELDEIRLQTRALGEAEVAVLRAARPGTARSYGIGCPLPGAPVLSVAGRPETDRRISLQAGGAPAVPTFLGLGLRDDLWLGSPLPFWLGGLGAPACAVLQDLVDTAGGTTDAQGRFAVPLLIPRDPGLVGQRIYFQVFQLVPGANPLGLAVSAGLELRLGGLR
jgi:hypothetical protein